MVLSDAPTVQQHDCRVNLRLTEGDNAMRVSVRFRSVFAAVVLMAMSGCATKAEKAFQRVVDSMNALAETLSGIKTTAESREAIPVVEAQFQEVSEAWREAIARRNEKASKAAVERLTRELPAAITRLQSQIERLQRVRGLAPEFWNIIILGTIEHQLLAIETQPVPPDAVARIREMERLIKTYGNQRTISLELNNLTVFVESEALARINKAAPNAAIVRNRTLDKLTVVIAPVEDFDTFLKSLDFGTVLFEDKSQGVIQLAISPEKLEKKRTAGGPAPDAVIVKTPEQLEEERKRLEEAHAEARRKWEEERKKREPNPDSPDYFDKLAEMMTSNNSIDKSKALDLLIAADPSKASAELRGKIARNFKQIAETGSMIDKPKAVRGLVVWGGQFSVPILITMLESGDRLLASDVIRALGELKDPRGVGPVAARLKDLRYRDVAAAALRSIGPAAEDALIEIAPTTDPQLCLLAVNLLGEVGTPKCFEVLRMGLKSRNAEVRLASKNAMAKINGRKTAGKPADSSP